VATCPCPLPQQPVRFRINASEWSAKDRGPDGAVSIGYVATLARYAGMDSRYHLEALLINPGHSSIALIQHPDRAAASGKEARLRSNLYGFNDCTGCGIHGGDAVRFHRRYPDSSLAVNRIVGSRRDRNFLAHGVSLRIDAV